MREILATEMLEALGVETSRTLLVDRDRRGAGAQRRALADPLGGAGPPAARPYPDRHLPAPGSPGRDGQYPNSWPIIAWSICFGEEPGENGPARLLERVTAATARLAASYIAAGFVHGVLNTDNIAITARKLRLRAVALDSVLGRRLHRRLFRSCWPLFVRAPARGGALGRSAARRLAAAGGRSGSLDPRAGSLSGAIPTGVGPGRFRAARDQTGRPEAGCTALLVAMETALAAKTVEIDRFFFDWRGGRRRAPSPADSAYDGELFIPFRDAIRCYEQAAPPDHPYWSDTGPCSMHIEEVEAIWSRIDRGGRLVRAQCQGRGCPAHGRSAATGSASLENSRRSGMSARA